MDTGWAAWTKVSQIYVRGNGRYIENEAARSAPAGCQGKWKAHPGVDGMHPDMNQEADKSIGDKRN